MRVEMSYLKCVLDAIERVQSRRTIESITSSRAQLRKQLKCELYHLWWEIIVSNVDRWTMYTGCNLVSSSSKTRVLLHNETSALLPLALDLTILPFATAALSELFHY
jgi:hypothetical protein